jgi:hypothetical protein
LRVLRKNSIQRFSTEMQHCHILIAGLGRLSCISRMSLISKAFQPDSILAMDTLDSTAKALAVLADVAQEFEKKYRRAVAACSKTRLPLTICTIYDGSFPDRDYQRLASTALTVFNDAILRVGFEFGLIVIDLRFVCSSPEDYANPIEPSSKGEPKSPVASWRQPTKLEVRARGFLLVRPTKGRSRTTDHFRSRGQRPRPQ